MPQSPGPELANPTANAMRARFLALWSRCGGHRAEEVYASLACRYGEPARHYHTLQHVRRCLRDLDWARDAIPDADVVELALWCHDVIYVPGASDNERCSAEWFRHWAGNGIAAMERVAGLILDTSHTRPPADATGCFAVDIDLAVLGYPRTWFCRDAVHLRAERPDLDAMTYDSAERAFLGTLLARPRIYLTEPFHTRYEARARRNLAWRLALPAPPDASTPLKETPP
ncbi:HD domain-containing protein [Cupriavidus sp. RAF12]|uniref:HD domain-containing protein n=1 Tax=Cupriavidus sp. RAF12 TaxID=3233050 RepID=UPI003F8ED467